MQTKMKSIIKNIAAVFLFCAMFFSASDSSAQCTAIISGNNNPQPGVYTFFSAMNPNMGNVWYWWDFGDGNSAYTPIDSVHHTYSFAGTFYVCLTATDSANGGCTNSTCQWLTVTGTPCNITPDFTSMDMGGGTIMFTDATVDNSGGSITGWAWSFGDGGTSTLQNPNHTYTTNSTYGVMLTVYNSLGCTDTIYDYVVVNSVAGCNLAVGASSTNTACGMCDGSITAIVFNGTAPFTYQWSNGATTQAISNLCAGTYNIIVTDAMGCTDFNTVVIQSVGGVAGTISIDTTNAAGGIVVFTGNATGGSGGPYHYSWYFPNGNPGYSNTQITTVQYAYPSTNTVCMSVYDSAWMCYDSICVTFSIGGGSSGCSLNSSVTGTQVSANSYQFTATGIGGMAPYTYSWNAFGAIATCGYNQQIFCGTFNNPGTYYACCAVTDAMGCTDTTCFTVVVSSNCNAQFFTYSYSDSTYIYNYSTAGAGTLYSWDFGDGNTSNYSVLSTYFTHHYAAPGNYTICLYLNDTLNGCMDTLCQNIYACALSADVSQSINGNIISLTGTITGNYTSFGWYLPSGMNTTDLVINDTVAVPGNYYFTFWATDSATGCYDSTSFSVPMNFIANNTISGIVWNDVNGNGVQDAGEPGIPNHYVQVDGNWIQTDANGVYTIMVADGTWNISVYLSGTWSQTFPVSPTTYSISVAGGQTVTSADFGLQTNQVTITGVVFNDANGNGVQDGGETGIANQWVQIGGYWASTNASGVYTTTVNTGSYNVHLYSIPMGATLTTPVGGSYTVVASTQGQIYGGNNFGLNYPPGVQNLVIYISPYTTVTPCFPAWYDISYYNAGSVAVNGTVTMNYDPNLTYTSASPSPTTVDAVNHIITWNVGLLAPGASGWIWVDFDASCSIVVGDIAFNAVTIQPIAGDAVPSNNIDTVHQVATASWDPNAKEVSPTGVGAPGYIHADQRLDYTIHFQNTGTAPAVNVVLVDTLTSEIDWSSIQILAYSHPMVSELDTVNGILRCYYNNIMLPDSGADYQGSMGYVTFTAMPKSAIADGAVINNFADIYFDFNVPVRTNTTVNTIDYGLVVESVVSNEQVHLYPNPANENAYLVVSGNSSDKYEVRMTNVLGQEIKSISGKCNQLMQIDLASMEKGIYFLNIVNDKKVMSVQKLIVQ